MLTMVDMDTGYVGVPMVLGNSPDNLMVRKTATFVENLRAEKNETEICQSACDATVGRENCRIPTHRSAMLEPIPCAEHQSFGGVKGAQQRNQAATRAPRTDIRARAGEDIVPGRALFQSMLRRAAWAHNRFHPQSHRGGTLGEIRAGTCYKSPLLPFTACMIKVPISPGLKRKLDVQWMK